MKRSSIARKAPLQAKAKPARRKPLRKRNAKRAAAKFSRNYGTRGAAVREMPCLVPSRYRSCGGRVEAAHAVARGMGGVRGDRRSLVPLCTWHHICASEARTEQRAEFERFHGLDLTAEAARIAAELDKAGYP